ncbi:hypothetical protein BKA62DRAFT_675082, partial [Auriculariales sp. MPI-PUGE-AT-0066]
MLWPCWLRLQLERTGMSIKSGVGNCMNYEPASIHKSIYPHHQMQWPFLWGIVVQEVDDPHYRFTCCLQVYHAWATSLGAWSVDIAAFSEAATNFELYVTSTLATEMAAPPTVPFLSAELEDPNTEPQAELCNAFVDLGAELKAHELAHKSHYLNTFSLPKPNESSERLLNTMSMHTSTPTQLQPFPIRLHGTKRHQENASSLISGDELLERRNHPSGESKAVPFALAAVVICAQDERV